MRAKHDEDINHIQQYILKKLKSTMYDYTTLSDAQKSYILLELILNWIDIEMEKRKISEIQEA